MSRKRQASWERFGRSGAEHQEVVELNIFKKENMSRFIIIIW
jgi:hypothetical protein